MATFNAVAAVGQAIRSLLKEAAVAVFPDAQFELEQVSDLFKPREGLGLSIVLYRVGMNATPRSLPPRIALDGTRLKPSLPLDLYYLIAPWGPNADRQHRLLVWAMRVLEDTPTLPAAFLNVQEPQDTFLPEEAVDLVCEPLSLQDLSSLWQVLERKMHLAATYVVRRVLIDSTVPLPPDGALVQTRRFGVGTLTIEAGRS